MHLARGRVNIWEQMVPGVYSWGNGDLQGAESLRAEDEGAARGHSRAEKSPGSLWRVLGLSWGKQEKDLGQGRDSLKPQGWAPFVVICGYLGCFHSWFLFFPSPLKNVTNSMRFLTSPALKNHFSHIPVSFTLHGQNPTCSHQNGLKSGDFQDQGTSIRNFSHLQQIKVFLHQANPPHPKGPSMPGAPNPLGARSAWCDFNLNLTLSGMGLELWGSEPWFHGSWSWAAFTDLQWNLWATHSQNFQQMSPRFVCFIGGKLQAEFSTIKAVLVPLPRFQISAECALLCCSVLLLSAWVS